MNMTLDEYKARAKADLDNAFEKGKAQGGGGADWLYYATRLDSVFGGAIFPENAEIVIRVKGENLNNCGYLFNNAKNIKSVKMITETPDIIMTMDAFCSIAFNATPTLELIDLTEFNRKIKSATNLAQYQTKLKRILGAMDFTNCTAAINTFRNCSSLEDVEFVEGTIGISLDFSACKNLKAESYDSIIKGHSKEVSVTLTLPAESIVRNVYDTKFGSGAWDAITAQYPNVTISYM